ncbi:MAG: acetyl-CoA C-acetyltransferase [Arenicella sp.]|jgi:acetyl-CoA C-acetyltransferase
MSKSRIYILGGHQSDFARNWGREQKSIFDLFSDSVKGALNATKVDPADIQVGHVGNFVSASYTGQAHLGGFFGHVDPALAYLPASSHEAACASGSMAVLAAMADLESGRYDLACVVGIEMMKVKEPEVKGDPLAGAAWIGKEWIGSKTVWPCAFSDLIDEYSGTFGVSKAHLEAISAKNYANAKHNPNAQSRHWDVSPDAFSDNDELNPVIAGNIRRLDCGQITDGAATVLLATHERAKAYAKEHSIELDSLPYIKGWGHINAPMQFSEKRRLAEGGRTLLPHVEMLFQQTLTRAGLNSIEQISGMEVHDCFNITEYMIVDHSGLYAPGEAWKAIENGDTQINGKLPINASGGLIGQGHPVGATGVRMLLDCAKQTTGRHEGQQIANTGDMMTFNLGGSTTTCASFVVGTV